MKPIRLALLALVVGVVANCAAYSQPPGYGAPPPPQQRDDYSRGYDSRYDDGRYDSGYDDRYYGQPEPRFEVGFFYDDLSPYGDWVRTREHGWAWFPRDVHPYWRPYQEGRWVMTEYGWTWVSYEPFGWATYHYGRWTRDVRFGWLWIPGNVWGPAWVSWQHGGGYVGWAPLPPAVGFEIGIGIRLGGFDLRLGIRPDAYNFVPERSFLEPRLSGYYLPTARNVTIINNTTNITNYTYVDNRVINRGIETQRIEQATGRRVERRRVSQVQTKRQSEIVSDEVRIYRPDRQKLETVRGKKRAEEEQSRVVRPQATREQQQRQPATERREAPEFVVAPRVDRTTRPDARQIEQRERREKQELQRYQAAEKERVEKAQREESAKGRAQANRAEIEKRHQEERQALQRGEREAAQQLEERQKAKREAALAKPPAEKPRGKQNAAAAKKAEDDKKAAAAKKKAEDDKKAAAAKKAEDNKKKNENKGRGRQQENPEPPPPA